MAGEGDGAQGRSRMSEETQALTGGATLSQPRGAPNGVVTECSTDIPAASTQALRDLRTHGALIGSTKSGMRVYLAGWKDRGGRWNVVRGASTHMGSSVQWLIENGLADAAGDIVTAAAPAQGDAP